MSLIKTKTSDIFKMDSRQSSFNVKDLKSTEVTLY